MEKIKPSNYIRLQRKICNPQAIISANTLAFEWGITPDEACYRLLSETLMNEYFKRRKDTTKPTNNS